MKTRDEKIQILKDSLPEVKLSDAMWGELAERLSEPIKPNTSQSMRDEIIEMLESLYIDIDKSHTSPSLDVEECIHKTADRLLQVYPKGRAIPCKHIKREGESCTAGNNCTYPDCPEVDEEERLNKIVDVIRSAWTPDDIESRNSDSDGKREYSDDEIHIMGEAYSKEFLGVAYKKDGLREISIELGYVDGFRAAEGLTDKE